MPCNQIQNKILADLNPKTCWLHLSCSYVCKSPTGCLTMSFHHHSLKPYLKKLNPFPNKLWNFMCLQYKSFENTVGKGEIAHNEQFPFFPQCYLLF